MTVVGPFSLFQVQRSKRRNGEERNCCENLLSGQQFGRKILLVVVESNFVKVLCLLYYFDKLIFFIGKLCHFLRGEIKSIFDHFSFLIGMICLFWNCFILITFLLGLSSDFRNLMFNLCFPL
jgi:hypothetical protein